MVRAISDFNSSKRNNVQWHEPSLYVILWYRFGQWINRLPKIIGLFFKIIHIPVYMILTLLTGIHLPRGCKIGPGLRIYHFGGIILNPYTVIGKNCTLRHNVTIGNLKNDFDIPVIGDNVDIGCGAVILGDIKIGNNVKIGANAVVIQDVPDNHIAVGNPAKILPAKD